MPTGPSGAAARPDRATWECDTNGLGRISLLLGIVLATVVARMIIDGLTLFSALTAALVLALLVVSLYVKQLGRRVRPDCGPNDDPSRSSSAPQS